MIMVSIQLNARFYKNDYSSKVQMTNEHFRNRSNTYLKQKHFFFRQFAIFYGTSRL